MGHPHIPVHCTSLTNDLEIVAVDVCSASSPVFRLITAYVPPSKSSDMVYMNQFFDTIIYLSTTPLPTILVGDFNRPGISWHADGSAYGSSGLDSQFIHTMLFCGFVQCLALPSHGMNFLSLLFCTNPNVISDVDLSYPFCLSDTPPHLPITFTVNAPRSRPLNSRSYDFGNADFEHIGKIVFSCTDSICRDRERGLPTDFITRFQACLSACLDLIPSRTKRQHTNHFIRHCAKIKLRAWRIFREYPSAYNALLYSTIASEYSQNVTFQRSKDLLALCNKRDHSALYRQVRGKTRLLTPIPPILSSSGFLLTDDKSRADAFLNYFSAIFTDSDFTPPCAHSALHPDCELLAEAIFSPSVIERIIKNIRSSAAGPDGIPAQFFKFTSKYMVPFLSSVFSECLRAGQVPPIWRHAIISPIFKGKGPTNDVKSYRPISVTCVAARIFERCLLCYLLPILKSCGAIPPNQYGSVPGRSTITQLVTAFHMIACRHDAGEPTDILYFDFDKAFDRVDRKLLFQRLRATPVHPLICHIIEVLFSCRSHQVKVGSILSSSASVNSGVIQGTVLGPILFILFTSTIPVLERPLQSFIFVDDNKWIAPVSCLLEGFVLQSSCDLFRNWCNSNLLPLSLGKCKVMHIGQNNPCFELLLGRSPIMPVSAQSDLGVIFREDLSFSDHCSATVAKAMNIVMMLRRCFSDCDIPTLVFAFQTYVNPILHYCSPVWSPSKQADIQMLERPLRLFSRHLPGMHSLSYEDRLGVLGLHSLEWLRLWNDLILCYKIVHGVVYVDPMNPIIQLSNCRTRGHPLTISIPFAHKNILFHSFVCRVARVWNALPAEIVMSTTLTVFRRALKSVDLSSHLIVFKF